MISIILPTVRPWQYLKCLEAIFDGNDCVSYEVIVVANWEPLSYQTLDKRIKWIYEPESKGVVDANIRGYLASQGKYIMTLSDEATLQPGALHALETFCRAHDNKVLTSPTHIPFFNFKYYGKWFAPFPFAHRDLIDDCGGLFLPEYGSFYADPDLSLRAYEKGYLVKECGNAAIFHPNNMACGHHQSNVHKYLESDREVFKKKWAHLGEFNDPQ